MKLMNTQVLANAMQHPSKFDQLCGAFSSHRDVCILWGMHSRAHDTSIVNFLDALPQEAVDALYAIHPHRWKGKRSITVWVDHSQRKAFLVAIPSQRETGGWYCHFVNWMKDVPPPLVVAPPASPSTVIAATVPSKLGPSDAQPAGDGQPPFPRPMPLSSEYEKWAKEVASEGV